MLLPLAYCGVFIDYGSLLGPNLYQPQGELEELAEADLVEGVIWLNDATSNRKKISLF